MRADRIGFYLTVILFGVIILFGESFKLNLAFVKISLPLLLIAILLVNSFQAGFLFYTTRLDYFIYAYLSIILLYTIIGLISGNSVRDVFEDLYPLLVFVLLYLVWRSWSIEQFTGLWKLIIVFGTLAAIKVIIIGFLPIEAGWDSVWQAAKEPLPLGSFSRIILRGGDIFLSISLVYYLLDVLRNKQGSMVRNLLYVLICLVAVFISLSRSSFLADFLAILFCIALFRSRFSTKKMISFGSILLVFLILILPFINAISLAVSIFEARTDAFDNNNIAVSFRENENELVRDAASRTFYLGNGMGSYFYLPLSGSEKMDGRSIYVHNFNYWLLLKAGFPGLVIFCSIYFLGVRNYLQFLRHRTSADADFMLITILAAGIIVWVISILANKFSTLSGAVFLAFFIAGSSVVKTSYENSRRS
ncbi:O-antigen ligase family protein [Flavihumibacter sp. UBA7668]|uniref:O-antigen ligase family protein n=1 Tax=Flavihumibacter sp. UBA7668 TaxID=1946542 RepID=UPI0025C7270D|nr:O-antigen ligase family protein [Flavihumibacter sp. UBA7668]